MTGIIDDLKPLAVGLDQLDTLEHNPRKGDIEAVAKSYETFGQRKPIVARRLGERNGKTYGEVLAGNHQLAAAKQLGWSEIAVVWVEDDDKTAAAYAIADNRVGLLGEWDVEKLLESLTDLDGDLLDATGFTLDDVDDFHALLQEGETSVTGSVEAAEKAGDGKVDTDVNVKADSTYAEFLERYAQRATRGVVLEFPADQYAWVNENFVLYRKTNGIESNTEAVIDLLARANNTVAPSSVNGAIG